MQSVIEETDLTLPADMTTRIVRQLHKCFKEIEPAPGDSMPNEFKFRGIYFMFYSSACLYAYIGGAHFALTTSSAANEQSVQALYDKIVPSKANEALLASSKDFFFPPKEPTNVPSV